MPIVKLKDKTQHFHFDEAIKMLRTNVEFAGENVQAVCITSCLPNEGKSSIVARLAESMAQAGKKVVLIDADLRKSVLLGRYIVEGTELKGLSHFLTGQGTISECLCQTDYPTLQMIFSGPDVPNPAELLGGKRFSALLEALRKNYDYVLIDTPPLGSVIDAAIVSRQCDGVALRRDLGICIQKPLHRSLFHKKKTASPLQVSISRIPNQQIFLQVMPEYCLRA